MSLKMIRLPYAPGILEPLTIRFRHERFNYDWDVGVMAEFTRHGCEPWRHAMRAAIKDTRESEYGLNEYRLNPSYGRNLSEQQLHDMRWHLMCEYIRREDARARG